jgi:L-threonylcarbamoyladenylate synthase
VIILNENKEAWDLATETIKGGELVVFPTDTVYGVGCNPEDATALERIYEAKGRPATKAVPLLLSDDLVLAKVAGKLMESARLLGERLWPGALTLVVQRSPHLPAQLGQEDTIAVRVPAHNGLRAFIAQCGGAIAATSANRSGEPDALNIPEAVGYLGASVSIYIDGGTSTGGTPSTVVDCTVTPARIVREGAINRSDIEALLGGVIS